MALLGDGAPAKWRAVMPNRLRRLRQTEALREVFRETRVHPSDLIYPIFVKEQGEKEPILSMPGQYRHSLGSLRDLTDQIGEAEVKTVLLFGIPEQKDEMATSSRDDCGI